MRIALATLNTAGTMGHYIPMKKLRDKLKNRYDVLMCSYGSDADIVLPHQEDTFSTGGGFRYSGLEQLVSSCVVNSINAIIFSTFFDPNAIKQLSMNGIKTALLTYPVRDSHFMSMKYLGMLDKFDRIFQYEDFTQSPLEQMEIVSPIIESDHSKTGGDILVTCGGGGRPSSRKFFRIVDDLVKDLLKRYPALEFTIVDRTNRSRFEHPNVKKYSWMANFVSVIANHKLVISEAGYHTVAELSTLGISGFLLPGSRRIDNQELRATYFAKAGFGNYAFPEEPYDTILERLEHLYQKKLHPESRVWTYERVDRSIEKWLG
jgi:UDP-N-acetylglucosamine:LPS N-acetylglucosamine transferase